MSYEPKYESREFVGVNRSDAVTKACAFFDTSEDALTIKDLGPERVAGIGDRALLIAEPQDAPERPPQREARHSDRDREPRGRDREPRGLEGLGRDREPRGLERNERGRDREPPVAEYSQGSTESQPLESRRTHRGRIHRSSYCHRPSPPSSSTPRQSSSP